MLDKQWKKLQNGSDVRGVALEGIEGQPVNLTNDIASQIAKAFVCWLSDKLSKLPESIKIAVGCDSRISSKPLLDAVADAITSSGADVIDCGMASTPAMYMTLVTDGYCYDGSIMITASHLPFNRNGLKFFIKSGGLEHEDITEILQIAQDGNFPIFNKIGARTPLDFISVYAKGLCDKIIKATGEQKPLSGLKIIVDAGNGAGGFFASKVLEPLGADTTGSQFLNPDGNFPNHIPNPEDPDAMDSIRDAVLNSKADLGLIFDTDVDRVGAVDNMGREINRNRLIALISAIAIEEHPGTCIVTDSVTSSGLKIFIESLGGIHYRYRRGYKNVINKGIELNNSGTDCQVAIETSGHAALKENYFLDDGAYLAVKLIIKMAQLVKEGKQLSSIIESLQEPKEAGEFRLTINTEDFKPYGQKLIDELEQYAKSQQGWTIADDNREGIRVSFDKDGGDGWFLLRLSLHDPVIPINIESNIEGGLKTIANKLYDFVKQYDKLNLSALEKAI